MLRVPYICFSCSSSSNGGSGSITVVVNGGSGSITGMFVVIVAV